MTAARKRSAPVLRRPGQPTAGQRRVGYAAISALLRYPDEALTGDLPLIEQAVADLPAAVRDQLLPFMAWLERTPLLDAQAGYVATFDLRRRCCLYLSYYLNGDTRRRGEALWRFKDACRGAGFRVRDGELPDYLPLLLELAASGGEREAIALIQEHRAGIELLLQALERAGSSYAHLISALQVLLPAAIPGTAASMARLAAGGPPAELVGIETPAALGPYEPAIAGPEGSGRR